MKSAADVMDDATADRIADLRDARNMRRRFTMAYTKELEIELRNAIADATILVHAYETDNRPPADILRRYGKKNS